MSRLYESLQRKPLKGRDSKSQHAPAALGDSNRQRSARWAPPAQALLQMQQSHGNRSVAQWLKHRKQPVQRVKDVGNKVSDICGPSALAMILDSAGKHTLGASPEEKAKAIQQLLLAKGGSAIGEIFRYEQLEAIAGDLGLAVGRINFGTLDELKDAIVASGDKYTMISVSNVNLPGKGDLGFNAKLISEATQWVRAHWIVITEYDSGSSTIKYKDNANSAGVPVRLDVLKERNEALGDKWNWEYWHDTTKNDTGYDNAKTQRGKDVGDTLGDEALDLTGYLVTIG